MASHSDREQSQDHLPPTGRADCQWGGAVGPKAEGCRNPKGGISAADARYRLGQLWFETLMTLECLDSRSSLENRPVSSRIVTSLATDLLSLLALADDQDSSSDLFLFRAGEVALELIGIGCELQMYPLWVRLMADGRPHPAPPEPTLRHRIYPIPDPISDADQLVRPRLADAIPGLTGGGVELTGEDLGELKAISRRINPHEPRRPDDVGERERHLREVFSRLRKMFHAKHPSRVFRARDVDEWLEMKEIWLSRAFRQLPSLVGSRGGDEAYADAWLAEIVALNGIALRTFEDLEEAFEVLAPTRPTPVP